MIKKTKKAVKKVIKVQIEQPEIEIAPETYKQEPVKPEPPKELPDIPVEKPVKNPNDPKMVGIDTGFKKPSITNVKPAYTKKQYKALMDAYEKQNPVKHKAKRSEFEAKLRRLR